jgi:leader peptidase (prepilin peptidase) / N-methyltransferase
MLAMFAVLPVIVFLFGTMIGSFANVCILRIPAEESIVFPRSRCPQCKQPVRWYDNIPLVSWIVLRGRCRSCDAPISFRYFVVELLTALAAVALYAQVGLGVEWLVLFLFLTALIIVTFIDLDHRIIPDVISLPGIVVGFILSLRGEPGPVSSAIGIVTGGGLLLAVAWAYHAWTGREGMGGGDIKLLGMIGAFLGWRSVPFTMLLSSLTGSLVGVTLMLWTGSDTKYAIPFGPFLALGAVAFIFCGDPLIAWYLGLGSP